MSEPVIKKKILIPEDLLKNVGEQDHVEARVELTGPITPAYARLTDREELQQRVAQIQHNAQQRIRFYKWYDVVRKKTKKPPYLLIDMDQALNDSRFLREVVQNNCSFISFNSPEQSAERSVQMFKVAQYAKEFGVYTHYKKKNTKRLKVARETSSKIADEFAIKIKAKLDEFKEQGYTTLESLTKKLNEENIATRSKTGKWHINTVKRIYDRTK